MPVRKYRSGEDMNQPVWRMPGDAALYEAIRRVWEFGQRTRTTRFRSGVRRFRNIEEMQAWTESSEARLPVKPRDG